MHHHRPLPPGLERLRIKAMNACALMLVLTPPLVWFGHTRAIFYGVLGAGLGAGILYCYLHRFEKPPARYEKPGPPAIPDAFFEELADLGALPNHHRLSVEGPIQERMNRLRRLVDDKRMSHFLD
ncbi:MAG: hypothetical protein HOE62_17785 [Alphaproteobacteria bacterium]|nr:hypothetical protein [Alphaproteobacteria bacterium]MBT4019808.1 hypothetical protein [Alphaproteobacteria bacterium]MBT4966192.1 hypothetical protein [Alphaproteobacteria bacterium]MBT5158615.1 hypothetical protein [Alphaproteobacteria bacterium]MBT5917633.1 hypothetical protein [Alphaproteobacteria bacterium]